MWLIRQFWLFYNIDPSLLKESPNGEKIRLAIYGFISMTVIAFAFFSIGYLAYLVTLSWTAAVMIGGVLGWNFSNLFRLILNTISIRQSGISGTFIGSAISTFLRATFLVLLIIIIIKPFEILLYEDQIEVIIQENEAISEQKLNEEWLDFIDAKINYYQYQMEVLAQEKSSQEELLDPNLPHASDSLIAITQSSIQRLNNQIESSKRLQTWFFQKKQEYIESFKETSSYSNNLVERFRILHKYFPETWIFTLLLSVVFLFPILIKAFTKDSSAYYKKEVEFERDLITKEYDAFRTQYQKQMLEATGQSITFFETCLDPPFNNKPIIIRDYSEGETEFKTWVSKHCS